MKDISEIVLKQSKEFGKKPNLNYTRTDIAVSKTYHIYRTLGKKTLLVQVLAGDKIIKRKTCKARQAASIVKDFCENFFLTICYTNDHSRLNISLTDVVPEEVKQCRQSHAVS